MRPFLRISLLYIGPGLLVWCLGAGSAPDRSGHRYPLRLSEWGFFEGPMYEQIPASDVWPYDVRAELFSDYAFKKRFVRLPAGGYIAWAEEAALHFPVGSVLIKTFYYPADFRRPDKDWQLVETRLLIHEEKGWTPITYRWEDDGSDAHLALAGDERDITWLDVRGRKKQLPYLLPTQNQCKGCHLRANRVEPVGTTVRMLNGYFTNPEGASYHPLKNWVAADILQGAPAPESWPQLAAWHDDTYTLEDRARAYLDANCGHCHRPEGAANTSGLFLYHLETNSAQLGIYKSPVAAGRGSGGLKYNIHPGKPKASILLHRMTTTEPGAMMPEIGRNLVHEEGVALIRAWINAM
jgi:uncharacterized repeat protein (TIGR03806 family)